MTDGEGAQATVPSAFEQWQTDLKKAADLIVQARTMKAGSIAGALVAYAGGRNYDHGGVLYTPQKGPDIVIRSNQRSAESYQKQLLMLNLPGIASVKVVPFGESDGANLRITPFPKPTS